MEMLVPRKRVLVELYMESRSCFEFFKHASLCQRKVSAPFSRPLSPFISFEALARQLKTVFVRRNPACCADGANGQVFVRVLKDREIL